MPKMTKNSQTKPGPDYIEKSLWPLAVPVAQLHEDPANVRQHPERSISAIAASLRRFKQQKPIVARKDGQVVAGAGTLAAARSLSWEFIAVPRSETLSESNTEAAAFAIADNRSADLSAFDEEGLSQVLQALRDDGVPLEEIGWTDQEFSDLLKSLEGPASPDDFKEFDDDLNTDFKCPSCGYEWSGCPS